MDSLGWVTRGGGRGKGAEKCKKLVVLLTVRRCSAGKPATGRSGRNHLHNRQDPDWPALNLIWLDKPNRAWSRCARPCRASHQFAICSSFVPRRLSLKKGAYLSMVSSLHHLLLYATHCTLHISTYITYVTTTSACKQTLHYALNRALHSSFLQHVVPISCYR